MDTMIEQLCEGSWCVLGWMQGNGIGVVGKLISVMTCKAGLSLRIKTEGGKLKTVTWTMSNEDANVALAGYYAGYTGRIAA